MGTPFSALIDTIAGWASKLYDEIRRPVVWLYGVILAAVIAPVNYIFGILESFATILETAVGKLSAIVDALHIADLPGYWAYASHAVSVADAWVPAVLGVTCGLALCALWVVCAIVRLVIRIKGIFWAGG